MEATRLFLWKLLDYFLQRNNSNINQNNRIRINQSDDSCAMTLMKTLHLKDDTLMNDCTLIHVLSTNLTTLMLRF